MPFEHTPSSRLITFVATVLVLLQVLRVGRGNDDTYVLVLQLALLLATAAATLRLRRNNTVESRLAVGLLTAMTAGGVVLGTTVGVPGQEPGSFGTLSGTTLGVALVLIVLLVFDRPWRRGVERHPSSPYAS